MSVPAAELGPAELHTAVPTAPDPLALRRALGSFPTGVTVVAGLVDGAPVGVTANSFTSVSLVPPVVSVCLARSSGTWQRLRSAERIGVSVLSAAQRDVCLQLSAPVANRFAEVGWWSAGGAVLLAGAAAELECSVTGVVPVGDHDVVLLAVHRVDADPTAVPLVFHRGGYTAPVPPC